MFKFILAMLAAACVVLPTAALAQDVPSYATPAQSAPADENIHGRIASFDGGYNLSVRDERGFVDTVQLHPGTIINPTGLTLAPGMVVSILGYNAGDYFSANQIDTPYQFYGAVPYYAGHPWNYYGPSISLGFFFGNAGWWHGSAFHGGYRFDGGARIYSSVRINDVYVQRGGTYHGRDYVAPREHGGYYAGPHHAQAHAERAHHDGGR